MLEKHVLSKVILCATWGLLPVASVVVNADEGANVIEEVKVTGSRLKRANLESTAPITQIDASEIRFQGVVRVEDLLRATPQIYSSQNTGQSNGATGTATINLRNLGEERTLVLVNGRRMPAGSPIQDGTGADINQIPARLIDRTEILTGGASAVYGSDAVAGVVNFVMKNDFEGVELDYQHSFYRHNNKNQYWRGLVEADGYDAPVGTTTDGETNTYSIIIGGNFDGGNVTAYATYRDIEPVIQANRDYSACSLGAESNSCRGSGTIPEGRVTDFGTGDGFDFIVDGTDFVDRTGQTFNFGALNYFQRPDERVTMGAFTHYEYAPGFEIYADLMYMDNRTVSQIAPSGAFFVTDTIPCGNPLLSDQQFDRLCGQFGLTRDDIQTAFVGKRNIEGGNRQQDLRHTNHRVTLGTNGELADAWSYDVSYLFSEVSMENTYLNDLSTTKIGRALDAVLDDDGNIVCRSAVEGYDTDCVPWNIFETGGITQDQIDYLVLPLFARGTTDVKVLSAYLSGDLGTYGVKLPKASEGVQVAFGIERRDESLDFSPDIGFQTGDGAGQGGSTEPVSGGYTVEDWFVEASVPILSNVTFAESLQIDFSYRGSDYDYGVSADSLGLGLGWAINDDFSFRGTYQEAIRGANVRELFQPQGLNLTDFDNDPCGGELGADGKTASGRTFEECARSGVTEEQFGSIPNNPAGQYNFLQGGSTDLKPEEAQTYTLGFIYTPTAIEGLDITLDYFDIEIVNGIDNLTPENILNQCLNGIDSQCANVNRGVAGDLWIGSDLNTSGFITAIKDNFAVEELTGFDLIANYGIGLGNYGQLDFANVFSYITKFDKQELASDPVKDCSESWGGPICGFPTVKLRNNFRATWETPLDLTATLLWRRLGPVREDYDPLAVSDPDDRREAQDFRKVNYVDIALLWSPAESIEFRAGVNNVFDLEPPIGGSNAGSSINGNGNTFPGLYDALGQFVFAGFTLSL